MDGDDAEGLVGGSVSGRESGGSGGGEDQVLELHLEGWFGIDLRRVGLLFGWV